MRDVGEKTPQISARNSISIAFNIPSDFFSFPFFCSAFIATAG